MSNQLVQLSARVEADRQQRAEEAEAERKRQAGEVTAEREHTVAMLQDQLASMRQILEKRSGDRTGGGRTGVAQDEPDGSTEAEPRRVFGASQDQLRSGRLGLRAPFLDGSVSPDQDRRSSTA